MANRDGSHRGSRLGRQRETGQAHRETPGKVEEVQLLDVAGQAAQLGDEGRQQGSRRPGSRSSRSWKTGLGSIIVSQRLERRRGRRVRRPVEQGELAEGRLPQRGDDGLLTFGRGSRDL